MLAYLCLDIYKNFHICFKIFRKCQIKRLGAVASEPRIVFTFLEKHSLSKTWVQSSSSAKIVCLYDSDNLKHEVKNCGKPHVVIYSLKRIRYESHVL